MGQVYIIEQEFCDTVLSVTTKGLSQPGVHYQTELQTLLLLLRGTRKGHVQCSLYVVASPSTTTSTRQSSDNGLTNTNHDAVSWRKLLLEVSRQKTSAQVFDHLALHAVVLRGVLDFALSLSGQLLDVLSTQRRRTLEVRACILQ